MDLQEVCKQGRDESMQEDHPTVLLNDGKEKTRRLYPTYVSNIDSMMKCIIHIQLVQ